MSISLVPVRAIFFDIGDTLVKADPADPHASRMAWLQDAKQSLVVLKDKGLRLGLLSNTGRMSRAQLLMHLPTDFDLDLFDQDLIILSSEVKAEKPTRRIFAHAIDEARLGPLECLFCTENLSHTLAAQEVNMRALWLQEGDLRLLVEAVFEDTGLWGNNH